MLFNKIPNANIAAAISPEDASNAATQAIAITIHKAGGSASPSIFSTATIPSKNAIGASKVANDPMIARKYELSRIVRPSTGENEEILIAAAE